MSVNVWRTIFAVSAGIIAYLLIQTDVTLLPIIKVALGAASVGLAILNPAGAGHAIEKQELPPPGPKL